MSFGDRLQQLASQQQGINQAMKQLGDGGKLSPEEQAKLGRIAADQGRAQKSMEDLAKEQKSADGKKQGLGSLEKIAEEMKESITDLKNNNITPETMKRQERILSRLLDATKSINDRDYEKTRESQTGKNYTKTSPGQLDLKSKDKESSLQDLLRSIQQGYTKDYETLIKQYFEALHSKEIPINR
jgi:O6-methylguanine-DNA--protein-cysteine methyltransferase